MSKTAGLVALSLSLLVPGVTRAHCDTLDGSVVRTARKALESGKVKAGHRERFDRLRAQKPPADDVTAGRAWVEAYVPYVEGVYVAAQGQMGAHAEPKAEALGASMDFIIPERLRGRHWGGWDHVMASGVTRYGKGQLLAVPALHKDGRQLSVEFSIQLLKDGAGAIEWAVAVFRDVTDRFQRDKALKLRVKELETRFGGPRLVKRLDARPLKAKGIHPVEEVLRDLAALVPGEAYELVTPHVPGAVLERAAAIGVRGVTEETGPEEFVTTFTRQR